jgi:REP element-mobilizing transposase RayT
MARPLRIEFPGALYHITARGDRQEPIYEDDYDRKVFLDLLGKVIVEWNWACQAYCMMGNHYHLLVETPDGNLAKGMRQLNGVYTQLSNRRHQRVGHLFQGRYKAILVDRDEYLLELGRYVVLNPVRARLVKRVEDWPWSSYRSMVGQARNPSWLATDALLAQFGNRKASAQRNFRRFVSEGIGRESIWKNLNRQIFLGDEKFIAQMHGEVDKKSPDVNIPRVQQRPPAPPLDVIRAKYRRRDQGIVAAYRTREYSYKQIAEYFRVHFTTVGRVVRRSQRNRTVGR